MGKSTFNNPLTMNMLDDVYRSIVESTSDSIYIVDQDCRYCFMNQSHLSRLGASVEEMIGRPYSDFHSPQPSREFRKKINEVFTTGKSILHEYKSLRDDRYFLRTISPLKEQKPGGKIIGAVVISKDINTQKQKEDAVRESEEKYKNIIENIDDGYLEIDCDWNTLFCNNVWLDIIGYTRKEFAAMNLRHVMDDETEKYLSQVYEDVYQTGKPSRGVELLIRRKDGNKINIEMSSSLIEDPKGKCSGFRNFIRNVTEQKKAVETIRRLAYHDPLTNLPNRLLFKDRLNMAIMRAKRNKQYLAVMMLDLDKFKDVNDTLGHHMGDSLLQDVGDRLVISLRKGDTVARMGGDEFLILLPDIRHIESSSMIAQKVVDAFQEPFLVDGHKIHITTSIGIAIYPTSSEDADTLVKNADIAMYRAKDLGRNNYQQFSPTMIT